jgi:probable F420-dependent oxidoreductase
VLPVSLACQPYNLPAKDPSTCVEVARMADEAGLYGVHFGEHVVMGQRLDRYPDGRFPSAPQTPFVEPLTTLAAMAAVTRRLRLSTSVLLVPLRPAVLLAKTVATLDLLSQGRVDLGVGTGWQREEYEAEGLDWSRRNQAMDDTIRACRALWRGELVDLELASVSLHGVWCLPRPLQPRIPILFGVKMNPTNARRVAELGDGWCPVGLDLPAIERGVRNLREAFEECGRDADGMMVRVRLPEERHDSGQLDVSRTIGHARLYEEAGVTIADIRIPAGLPDLNAVARFVHDVASHMA